MSKKTRDISNLSVGDQYEENGEKFTILGVVEDGVFAAYAENEDEKVFLAKDWEEV